MKDQKGSLTQEDVETIARAFSNANRTTGAQTFKDVVAGFSFFPCEIGKAPSMLRARQTREWCFIDERLDRFDPLTDRVWRPMHFGLIQMETSSSEAQVLARIHELGLDPCDFGEMLAAVLDPKDPLKGQPVIALGTTLVDYEGHRLHPRHNSFWAGERTLDLKHENTYADADKKYMATKRGHDAAIEVLPDGFPPQFRFLVKRKMLS